MRSQGYAIPWSVYCLNDNCPWRFGYYPTEEEAVEAWNRRGNTFPALYHSINAMLAVLGAEGTITPRHETVTAVMDALHDIDGGEYRK